MKVKSIEAPNAPKSGQGFGQNEDRKAREKRMKAFWASAVNVVVNPIGQLLAAIVDGKTLATHLVEGQEIELDHVMSNGTRLDLPAGFKLSLAALSVWSCPACRSAHGSGVYPSREKDATRLARNKFYYRPADKALFVISDTCFSDYVKGIGANTDARFVKLVAAPVTTKGK